MWPRLRAVLISLACIVALLDGCPMPPHEQTKAQVPALAPTLKTIDEIRLRLLRPLRGVSEVTQISQRWSLFRAASRSRYRMRIEGKTGNGEWQPVFRAGDADVSRYADVLHFRRVRGIWNMTGRRPRDGYDRFCRWINTRVLDDHPTFDTSRVVLERIAIGEGGGYTPTGELVQERVMDRRRRR